MPTTTTRTIVAVHGISSGGDDATKGYTQATATALANFAVGMGGPFKFPFVEALWADLAQESFSKADATAAEAAILAALGPAGATAAGMTTLLSWFGVPGPQDLFDMIADIFIYAGARRPPIRDHVRAQIEAAHKTSGRGVVLHGNSLGSVVALDVLVAMLADGTIGPDVDPNDWPVRSFLTTGSPLGLDLAPLVTFSDRATELSSALSAPLDDFVWKNVYDRNDPVVTGSILGTAIGGANLTQHPGYTLLNVDEATIQTGAHLISHLGYWKAPLVAQELFGLVRKS